MTSVAAWAGVDSRGVSSLYIATDSRISWGPATIWDQGRKTFASRTAPVVLGYWGDVLFPSLALASIVDRIDHGLTRPKPSEVVAALRIMFADYPTPTLDIGILCAIRQQSGMRSQFELSALTFKSKESSWEIRTFEMPDRSSVLHFAGSGVDSLRNHLTHWQSSPAANTSRAVYSAFCESISSGDDGRSGGPPQLVGLYRIGNGQALGVIHGGKRYMNGSRLTGSEDVDAVDWRNQLFERVDGSSRRRLQAAARHEDHRKP